MKKIKEMTRQILQSKMPWRTVCLTDSDYEEFKKCYTIMALRGKSYGQAFCEYFNINDYVISVDNNQRRVDKLIRHSYLKRQQVVQELYKEDK